MTRSKSLVKPGRGLTVIMSRLPALLWCLSRILLQDSRILRKSLHIRGGHHSVRSGLSRSTSHHALYPALPAVAASDDMGRVYVLYLMGASRLNFLISLSGSISIAGLVLGSFASTLEMLILTQGVAYGVGFLIFYYPILSMINEYWIARRGMAYGVLCGASGVSGSVTPFVLQALLAKYGYRTTLRAVAVALTLLTGPFIPLLNGRLPPSERASVRKINWTFLRSPLFWVYSASNLLQGLGYFFPSLYLPSYASSLRLGDKSGPLLLALMSVCQVCGQFVFGLLSDYKVPLNLLACLSTVVAAVACFTMWRLGQSLTVLIFFAMVYGFFGTGFTAIWARMSTAITDDVTAIPIVFTMLNFGKGIGNVLAGPVGGLLVSKQNSAGTASASSYRWVIVFTGTCMFASTCMICLRYTKYLGVSLSR